LHPAGNFRSRNVSPGAAAISPAVPGYGRLPSKIHVFDPWAGLCPPDGIGALRAWRDPPLSRSGRPNMRKITEDGRPPDIVVGHHDHNRLAALADAVLDRLP